MLSSGKLNDHGPSFHKIGIENNINPLNNPTTPFSFLLYKDLITLTKINSPVKHPKKKTAKTRKSNSLTALMMKE